MLLTWLRDRKSSRALSRRQPPRPAPFTPAVEVLEDRNLLSLAAAAVAPDTVYAVLPGAVNFGTLPSHLLWAAPS
jgi:hypothetical protein